MLKCQAWCGFVFSTSLCVRNTPNSNPRSFFLPPHHAQVKRRVFVGNCVSRSSIRPTTRPTKLAPPVNVKRRCPLHRNVLTKFFGPLARAMGDVFTVGITSPKDYGLADFLHRLPEITKPCHVFRRDSYGADVGACPTCGVFSSE